MNLNVSEKGNSLSNNKKLLISQKVNLIQRLLSQPIIGLFFNFINDYSELKFYLEYLRQNKYNIPRFLLLNKNCIDNILYISDVQISIDSLEINHELNNFFYLSLLIMDNTEIINYTFSLNFLNKINKANLSHQKNLTKILISKFILEMINYFKELDEYEEKEHDNLLNTIEKENTDVINNNINIFSELNLNININNFLSQKIDEIYGLIIVALIKLKKFNEKEYINDILNQLDLDNICITETIFNKLSEILNSNENENYLQEYILVKENDLYEKNKINFYYFLFKYILKDSIYIYQIPFLLKMRNNILKLLKANRNLLGKNLDEESRIKLDYVLKYFVDSEYYFAKKDEFDSVKLKLEEVRNYYKECFPKPKAKDIEIIDNIINNKKGDYEKYLSEYDKAKKINDRIPIIKFVFNCNQNDLNDSIEKWKILEKMIKDKKIKKMKKKEKINLINYFKEQKNKEKLIEIFSEDIYEFIINSEIKNEKSKKNNNLEENQHKNEIGEKIEKNENFNKIDENVEKKDDNNQIDNKKDEIKNIINEQFIDNSPPVLDINKENNKPDEQFNKDSENSFIDKMTSNNSDNNTEVKPEELIGNSAPLLPIEIKSEIINIMSEILKKSLIIFEFNRTLGNNLIFKEVYFGESNIKIDINKFKESLLISLNSNILKKDNNIINNYKNFCIFLNEIEKRFVNEFIRDYPLKIKLEFLNKNINSKPNISCIYTFFEPFTNKKYSFIEDNILINGTNSNLQGFQFMIFQINNLCYENIKEIYNNRNKKENEGNNNNILKGENSKKEILIDDTENFFFFKKTANEDKIIEFIKIIESSNNYIGLIKELNNGNYISYKNNKTIILYDTYFNRIKDHNFDSIINITEITNYEDDNNKDISKIVISAGKDIILMKIDFKTSKIETKTINLSDIYSINFFEIKKNNYIITGNNICIHTLDLFNSNSNNNGVKKNIIESKSYFGGIKINENTIALSSNSLKLGGEDKLIFYNAKTKRILNELEGYSYSISSNGLTMIQTEKIIKKSENPQKSKKNRKKKNKNNNNYEANEKVENEKILLCACKRYKKKQENGILLINPQIYENKSIENHFYNTGNFEPYCFCQILIVENNNKDLDNIDDEYKKNIKIKEADYFFVGGFDEEKRRGSIKLYKVNFNENSYNRKIDYLQDIELNVNFDGPINCIIQSRISGNILVTCYNGNIYLFTLPNINFYLEEEGVEIDNNKLM